MRSILSFFRTLHALLLSGCAKLHSHQEWLGEEYRWPYEVPSICMSFGSYRHMYLHAHMCTLIGTLCTHAHFHACTHGSSSAFQTRKKRPNFTRLHPHTTLPAPPGFFLSFSSQWDQVRILNAVLSNRTGIKLSEEEKHYWWYRAFPPNPCVQEGPVSRPPSVSCSDKNPRGQGTAKLVGYQATPWRLQ